MTARFLIISISRGQRLLMTTDKPMTRVLVAGASGASGCCVVQALLSRGYQVIAVVRPETAWSVTHERFEVVRADVSREPQWYEGVTACDAVVSCLASRTGGLEDARRVEFDANRNVHSENEIPWYQNHVEPLS